MIDKQSYIARISNATPLQLLVISYDMFLDSLGQAKKTIDTEDFSKNLEFMEKVLIEIIGSLNLEMELAKEVLPLYVNVQRLMGQAQAKAIRKGQKDGVLKLLDDAEQIMTILLDGIKQLEEVDAPAMDNSQQIYAGLTYQKGGVLKEFISEDSSKSFKA